MAANIALTRSNTPMIASREMTWHKQGIVLPEKVSGREMLKAAGLDWNVRSTNLKGIVQVENGGGETAIGWDHATDTPIMGKEYVNKEVTIEGRQAVYRDDTGAILGTTSDTYQIFQNHESVEVIDSLVKDEGLEYEVAGALGSGERIWVLASIKDLSFDVKGDGMKQYLTIFTSHDGTSALNIFPTQVRVVCANTWRRATVEQRAMEKTHGKNNVKCGFHIKHTRNMREMVKKAAEAFKATIEANKFSREFYASLAEIPATKEMTDEFFNFIADNGKDEMTERAEKRKADRVSELKRIATLPTNNTLASAGTAWGLLNTGIEYVDFYASTRQRNGKSEEASRFESSQFGTGVDDKDEMFTKIAELAGV